jgi:hypothetical protein
MREDAPRGDIMADSPMAFVAFIGGLRALTPDALDLCSGKTDSSERSVPVTHRHSICFFPFCL